MKILTNSFDQTQKIGQEFAKRVKGGETLLLYGDLGAGKTTFLQGFAKGLGVKKRIISPTFIIMRTYDIPSLSSRAKQSEVERSHHGISHFVRNDIKTLYHIDLYRTQTGHDLEGLGISEILADNNAVVAIEWPEKLGSFLPKKRWELHFKTIGENERSIIIEKV